MKLTQSVFAVFTTLAAALLVLPGCREQTQPKAQHQAEGDDHDGHAHEHGAGPHGGEIIELGTSDYHAEIVHDGEATVYILDGSAKTPAALDATELTVNVSHDGKAEQFKLTAKPANSDPVGKSSAFASADPELVGDLKEGHAEVQLVLTLEGKQYRGTLQHDHEHEEGHSHEEGEEDEHSH